MTQNEVVENYRTRIEEFIGYAYSNGYREGHTAGTREINNLRSECHLEAGDHDSEYEDGWNDHTPFYGWCSSCGKPISGRWGHVYEYCPWCGGRLKRTLDEPYPTGMISDSGKTQKLLNMVKDINPEEIKSHDTEDSLKSWCGAWQREMNKLIKACMADM